MISIIAIVALSSCNSSDESKNSISPKKPSWCSAKLAKYQLIRPIDFYKGATDAYNLPIREGQWYLVSRSTECYLLPVKTDGGMGPSFIENVTKWNKIATIDTILANSMSNTRRYDGLEQMSNFEIVCFDEGYSIVPSTDPVGGMTVVVEKSN